MHAVNHLPLSNQKPVPRFFVMNLVATDNNGQVHLYLFTTVAMSQQDAFARGLETMRKTIPELYQLGQSGTGFEVASVQEITQSTLQKMFTQANRPAQRLNLVVAEPTKEEVQDEKNKLIKQIIESRDTALLEANRTKLTEYEIAYIQDTIR